MFQTSETADRDGHDWEDTRRFLSAREGNLPDSRLETASPPDEERSCGSAPTGVTREYQSDSSSKTPVSSVASEVWINLTKDRTLGDT